MKSLYAKYLEEVANRHIIEEPYGFISYDLVDKVCYIADFFVLKEHRGKGFELFEKVKKEAVAAGCVSVMGRIEVASKTCNKTLSAYLKCGFKLLKAEYGMIYITKDF
jgi:GNAT superfamily N-acetyltransferase